MWYKYLFFVLITTSFCTTVKAQAGFCPSNMDFEEGTFNGWTCQTGSVANAGGINTITWSGLGQVNGRHTIISSPALNDFYGGFPQICPNGSQYSVKLGNNTGGHEAESIAYTYTIPSTLTIFSILFNYAVVLNDGGHPAAEQPRFRARITDLTNSAPIPCVTFDFTASSSLPGFKPSLFSNVIYKDWTPVTINLSAYIGRTIKLEFITSDCTFNQHFGYAYIDVNANCNGAISGNTICTGDTAITLTAPFGFQSYKWYADNSFTQLISAVQTLTLNPAPTVGTVFPVVVEPYNGFGCTDTLYATITVSAKPVADAGADASICEYQQVQVGGASTPGYSYSWTPANLVSNPSIANPFAWSTPPDPAELIVTTKDILTGCFSTDTVIVSSQVVDTSIRLTGKNDYCFTDPLAGSLSTGNSLAAVQWFDDTGPIPGAVSLSYQPVSTGKYWAQLTQSGCTDSTATVNFIIHPLPKAIFSPVLDTGCITSGNTRMLTNASAVSDGSAMTYLWKFSDGDLLQIKDAAKTFTAVGPYTVELVTTTASGCKDSTIGLINIFPNGTPNFLWDSVCTSRPVLFKNLSNEKGSSQVNYNWNFNNGSPQSLLKNPPLVTYTTPGRVDVTLKLTALGCENDPKSATRSIQVNKAAAGVKYRDITIPLGGTEFIHVRDTIGNIYNWRPKIQLSNYSERFTQFFATDKDVNYLVDITDGHTCVTTDTMKMQVLRKPGYYLPSAFTPNGDGLNDTAIPYLVGMKSLKSFSVFNRWGQLIFFTKTEYEGWNGKYNGIAQAPGVYVWILEFISSDDKSVTEKGTITIIR